MTDPIVPIIGGQRPETELQQRLREAERNRVAYSLNQAMRRDPNKVAERVNLNLSATVDDYIVAEEKRRRDVERITGRTAMSPATSEWLSNPDYSSISWDDADNLARVERGITGTIGDIFTTLAGGTLDAIFGAGSAILSLPERMIESYRTAGYSPPAFRKMLLEDLQRQGYAGRQLKRIEQQITPQTQEEWIQEGGVLPAVSSVLKQAQEGLAGGQFFSEQLVTPIRTPLKDLLGREGVDPSSTRAAVYSGFRSLPAMLAVAPLYPVLGVHGAGAAFVVPLYGNAINRARAEGLDESSAHVYALGQAGLEYLTNIVPGGKFLAGMKLKSPLFQRIKDQLPAEFVQENIATATQDLLDAAVLEPEKTFAEYLAERPQAAWHTIVATTVGVGALNTAVRAAERLTSRVDRETQATEAGGEMLSDLIENVRQTETQKRAPKVAAHFQNLALETKGLESVRIESEVLSQILSESEQQAEFLQEFPGIAQQLNQNGTDPGTEVEMKTGDFVSLVALNEKYQDIATKMQPNLRVGTAEFSLAEESAIEEERRAIREGLDDQMQDTIAREERNAEQRALIRKELESFAAQMPNISPKKARDQAEIAVTAWENLAKANEMEVGELWELMKPTLVAGEITIPELSGRGALFQPEQIDAPYTVAIEAGDMETAQRLADEAGNRAGYTLGNLYHGTTAEFDVFDPSKSGSPLTRDVGAIFLSMSEDFAREYPTRSNFELNKEDVRVIKARVKPGRVFDPANNPEVIDEFLADIKQSRGLSQNQDLSEETIKDLRRGWWAPWERIMPQLFERYDTLILTESGQKTVVVKDPSAIKSAEAITRDADGNIIPLSQRFDVTQESILYAPDVSTNIDAAYMAAAEAGDMETAQRLVARAAGVPDVFDDQGIGAVPYNQEVDYKGFRLFLPASDFLSVVPGKDGGAESSSFVEERLRSGAKIGQPFLAVEWNEGSKSWKVVNHEGRSRSAAFSNVFGNAPMEVHVLAQGMRASSITAEMRSAPIVAQDSDFVLPHSPKFSAEAITRDAEGNIIPLSQRFDVTQPSILYAPDVPSQPASAYQPKSKRIVKTEADIADVRTGDEVDILAYHETMASGENIPKASELYPGGPDPLLVSDPGYFGRAVYFSFGNALYDDPQNLHATIRAKNVLVANDIPAIDPKSFGGQNLVYDKWGNFSLSKAKELWQEGVVSDLEYAGAIRKHFTDKSTTLRDAYVQIYNRIVDDLGYDAVIWKRETPTGEQSQIAVHKLDIISDRDFEEDTLQGAKESVEPASLAAFDSEYLQAVNSGNHRLAKQLVNRSAQMAGLQLMNVAVADPNIVDRSDKYKTTIGTKKVSKLDKAYDIFSGTEVSSSYAKPKNILDLSSLSLQRRKMLAYGINPELKLQKDIDLEARSLDFGGILLSNETLWRIFDKYSYDAVLIKPPAWEASKEPLLLVRSQDLIVSADEVVRDESGNVIPLSERFGLTEKDLLYAPDTGGDQRRGAYLPRSMQIILTEKADASTLIHEFTHHYLHTLSLLARNENAPEAITSQFQTLLDWFGVADMNAWDALPAEQKAVHHEAFTYNFEIFIGSGKAPTKKLETVFTRVAKWMRGIYGKIRSTLNEAYRKEFGRDLPALTADVRQVFETMLGAEAEVAEAAADLPVIPIYRTQEESGMSDEVWEAYNQDAELYIDQATNELTARTARAQKWLDNATARVIRAKTKQAKQQRKAIRDRIQAEVEQEPVYRAITMLRRGIYVDEQGNERKVEGQHRLNTKLVQELFPKDPAESGYVDLSPLRAGRYGMLAKDGVDPAVVANQFGFASAADLIKALVAARPINDVINEQTDAEIVERHPELKPEAIKQAAMEALHNDALARFKATELKFLAGINKSVRVIVEAARREAAAEIARMSYRSIKPSKFLAAERRAGKAAQRWMATGDRQAYAEQAAALRSAQYALRKATKAGDAAAISQAEKDIQQARQVLEQEKTEAKAKAGEQPGRATVDAVIRAKWNELYQGLLYREAVAARKRFTKHAKYLRRIAKQKDRGKKIGADHSEQIDHILRRLDIRGVSARTDQQRQAERVKFQAWLDDQSKSGMEYPISDAALEVASLRSIEQIPMESLDDIVDAIEQIYHAGNRIRNAFLMARNKRLDEIKKEIIDNVVKYAGKIKPLNVTPNTVFGRAKKSLHVFFVQHIKTSTKAYVIDGGEYGAFWNTIIRTANRNQGAEQIEVSDVTKQLQGIMEPFYAAGSMTQDSGAVMPRRVYNAETGKWSDDPNRAPRSLSREEVFVLALDLGNDSNIQRVVDGFGITEDEAKQIVSVLTTDELKAVQKIWDLFASFKPRVSEMERRLNGKEPTYLTPKPITLVSNDGTQVELSGGYFPVKYDRSASELGTSIEAATQAKMQLDGAFIGNQTRDSYKKTRVARVVNRPLLLQASRMFSGLNEIIHDIHWREWLVDINLIMRPDGSVSRAIIENYGAEWMEDIRRWIKDIAAAGPGPMHPAEQWLGLMRRFISISRLGFSPVTAAIQQTGNVVAVQHLGAKHVADATTKFLGDMRGAHSEMLEKSPEMRTRFQTRFRELGEVAARISGKKELYMRLESSAYAMILWSQAVPDTITWHAAYSRAFEDSPGISDREAADRAFQAVLDTQGSGDLVNLSTIERGGPGSKLLTVFYTWQNTLFNEIYKIAKTEGLSAEGMTRLATLSIVLPFLTVIIRDLVPDDEDELKKRRTGTGAMTLAEQYAWRTLEESINTLLGSVVGVRELASPIASILSGERPFEYRGPAGFAPIADLIAVFNAGAESGVISKRFGKRFLYFLGDLSGIPATQLNRTWDGIDAVMSGDDVPWWAVALGTQK